MLMNATRASTANKPRPLQIPSASASPPFTPSISPVTTLGSFAAQRPGSLFSPAASFQTEVAPTGEKCQIEADAAFSTRTPRLFRVGARAHWRPILLQFANHYESRSDNGQMMSIGPISLMINSPRLLFFFYLSRPHRSKTPAFHLPRPASFFSCSAVSSRRCHFARRFAVIYARIFQARAREIYEF